MSRRARRAYFRIRAMRSKGLAGWRTRAAHTNPRAKCGAISRGQPPQPPQPVGRPGSFAATGASQSIPAT
eukprot:2872394-Prymnesium_polylepis.1